MITGQGLTIIPWTNPNELPKGYSFHDTQIRTTFDKAADAMKEKYPSYQEKVFYHVPTRVLWMPIWESEGK
jgi:hypothetical protein